MLGFPTEYQPKISRDQKQRITAAKCEELEARISALEQALELLEAAFEAHVSQNIPTAHDYIPDPSVSLFFNDGILEVFVSVDSRFTSDRVAINLDTFVAFDIFPIEDNQWEFVVTVNGDSDSDVLSLELPEEKPSSNLQIDGSFQENTLVITVADDESEDTTQIEIPLPEANEHIDIAVVETRPYRAFIESVDETGTAICHAKYLPVEP